MPKDTELDERQPGSQVREVVKCDPSWTVMAGKGIGYTVSAITLFAILELTLLQFVPSKRASTELTVAVIAGAVLLPAVGSILYFHRNRKIRLWTALAAEFAVTAVVAVMAAAVVAASQRPAWGTDGGSPASLSLAQAEQKLNSTEMDTRRTGIAELQLIMQAQPGRQPVVIGIICKFIVTHSPASPSGSDLQVTGDVQAALTVLARRNPARDGGAVIDLDNANLTGADLGGAYLARASLSGSNGADLTGANLADADLSGADLANSYFGGADLAGTNLSGADLASASFYQTRLCSADNRVLYPARDYDCQQ